MDRERLRETVRNAIEAVDMAAVIEPDERPERLVALVPQTAEGVDGVLRIMRAEQVKAWTLANAADLIEQGYVRLVQTDYVATQAFGDKRHHRR